MQLYFRSSCCDWWWQYTNRPEIGLQTKIRISADEVLFLCCGLLVLNPLISRVELFFAMKQENNDPENKFKRWVPVYSSRSSHIPIFVKFFRAWISIVGIYFLQIQLLILEIARLDLSNYANFVLNVSLILFCFVFRSPEASKSDKMTGGVRWYFCREEEIPWFNWVSLILTEIVEGTILSH